MQTKKLITLIKNITGVEPFNKSRKTPNVFARAIFYKILYDRFKTSKVDISRKVNKHHATILHTLNHFDVWVKQNKKLKSWYDSIILVLDEEDVEFLDVDNIYQKFIYLREENELLKTTIKNLKLKLNEKGNDKESI